MSMEYDVETNDEALHVEEIDYTEMKVAALREIAKEKGIKGYSSMNKEELIESIGASD